MIVVLAAFAIGVCSVVLCLSQVLGPERHRDLGRRIRGLQFTILQMLTVVLVAALLFHAFTVQGPGVPVSLVLLSLGFLVWFFQNWQKEFLFLMGLRDDQFPGRHDKLIWAVVLLAFAPIGIWLFRAYRLAHWLEPASAPAIDAERRTDEAGGTATQPA